MINFSIKRANEIIRRELRKKTKEKVVRKRKGIEEDKNIIRNKKEGMGGKATTNKEEENREGREKKE